MSTMSASLESAAAFEASTLGFLYRQWITRRPPVPIGTNLNSQVAIITGSNSGLGLEAGRQLLQLGLSHLIVAVRSTAKGEKAAESLRSEFHDAQISVWSLDMESYDSIKGFVEWCKSLPRIDIALLNAGLSGGPEFKTTEATGHEHSFQVNYLSTMLLAILLLPILKTKRISGPKPPVLSIVTSDTAFWQKLETPGPVLAEFDKPNAYDPFLWYGRAKLLQMLFITKLAQEVNADDVVVNLANPGLCHSEFQRKDGTPTSAFWATVFTVFITAVARSTAAGASTYVDAVVLKRQQSHGSYVSDWTIKPFPQLLYTQEGADIQVRLWEETMEELHFAGVSDIIKHLRD
ncbi:retinol dehydrogenase 12 [Xylariaceae sp. FL1019]|nr:retinol dehydrogenase 12 [Xylariaceae sp. FL1019]